jgi:superfamily I DNA/RNA helicase
LVTCFTRALAARLRAELHDHRNVRVQTLDQLMHQAREAAGTDPVDYREVPREALAQLALDALTAEPRSVPRFDHVLIDEAQDFPTPALQFAVRLLRDGSDSLVVAADPMQNIYGSRFTWKAAGINAVGRSRWLSRSYRNTREILEYAQEFVMADGSIMTSPDPDPEDQTSVVPPQQSPRSGPLPTFLYCGSYQEEVAAVAKHCRALLDKGVKPSSIAILYGATWAGGFHWPDAIVRVLGGQGLRIFWANDPDRYGNRDRVGLEEGKIQLCTIHSAKGLEFAHVILCGYLDDRPPERSTIDRRVIYVGMTRASHELVLTASGSHPYIADLERG